MLNGFKSTGSSSSLAFLHDQCIQSHDHDFLDGLKICFSVVAMVMIAFMYNFPAYTTHPQHNHIQNQDQDNK